MDKQMMQQMTQQMILRPKTKILCFRLPDRVYFASPDPNFFYDVSVFFFALAFPLFCIWKRFRLLLAICLIYLPVTQTLASSQKIDSKNT